MLFSGMLINTTMTIDQFWKIIDEVHAASGGDMEVKCELLTEALRKLSVDEIEAFSDHFSECKNRAYTKALMKAHDDYFSDDGFMDFQAALISQGRATFERLVARPNAAACRSFRGPHGYHESFAYPIHTVLEEMTEFAA